MKRKRRGYSAIYLFEREVPITKNTSRARRRETEAIGIGE